MMKKFQHLVYSRKKRYSVLAVLVILSEILLLSGCSCQKTCSDMLGEKISASSTQVCIRYEDVDGSLKMGKSRISVERNEGECEFHLEYQFDGFSDWYVHEIKGDNGEPFEQFSDPDCKRPQFDQTTGKFLEAQTAFYWVMRARDYAKDNLWVTPDYWPFGTPSFNKNDLSVNILDEGFGDACLLTPGNPRGCFRPWPNTAGGIKINLREGVVGPEIVIHEYGHYAAGFVFGHTPNEIIDTHVGWIAECYKRSFNEAIADVFLHLFFHSERFGATTIPNGILSLTTSAVWGDSSLNCESSNSDYTEGRPLVQAVHESLWDPVWADNKEANKTMVQAFSYALQRNSNNYDIELLAEDMLKYINKTLGDNTAKVRINEIFELHGFEVPLEVIDFDFEAVNDPDNEYFTENGYYRLNCTEDHMQYSDVKFFRPIIKLNRPAPTGINMTVIIYTEYTFDDPKIGIFNVRFEKGEDEPSSISLSNDIPTVNILLNQDIQRMPVGSENHLIETRGFWLGCTKNCAVRGNGKKSHGDDLKVYLKIDQFTSDKLVALVYPDKSESRHVKCIK
jgi:hypothetical protein